MAGLRERLVAALARAFTRAALIVAPRPPLPPIPAWFVPGSNADCTIEMWFVKGSLGGGGHHVTSLMTFDDGCCVLVDGFVGRSFVHPVGRVRWAEHLRAIMEPDYVVTVRADSTGHMEHNSIGPVTCVTLAKRLLGVHNPGIVTSRQLLDLLWRCRADEYR